MWLVRSSEGGAVGSEGEGWKVVGPKVFGIRDAHCACSADGVVSAGQESSWMGGKTEDGGGVSSGSTAHRNRTDNATVSLLSLLSMS